MTVTAVMIKKTVNSTESRCILLDTFDEKGVLKYLNIDSSELTEMDRFERNAGTYPYMVLRFEHAQEKAWTWDTYEFICHSSELGKVNQ